MANIYTSFADSPCHIVPATPLLHRALCSSQDDAQVPQVSPYPSPHDGARRSLAISSSPHGQDNVVSLGESSTSPNQLAENHRRRAELHFGERLVFLQDFIDSPRPTNELRPEQIVPTTETASPRRSPETSSRTPTSSETSVKPDTRQRLNFSKSRARKQKQRTRLLNSTRPLVRQPNDETLKDSDDPVEIFPFGGSEESIFL